MKLAVEAPAKVNLCLAVEYPPHDGYHALSSVFQALSLHDTLRFSDIADDGAPGPGADAAVTHAGTRVAIALSGRCKSAVRDLPAADNLVFRALEHMEQAFHMPASATGTLNIAVEKRIPAGGGLGGGSSDAAAAIKAYAQTHGIDVLDPRCIDVARLLGADVAFFLYGGAALMDGRGDRLVRRLPPFPFPLVLMGEAQGISTARVYADFDAAPPRPENAGRLACAIERWGGAQAPTGAELAGLCGNNLEPAACAACPRLAQRVASAKASPRVLNALVTGSGSTSYAICKDPEDAQAFAREAAGMCDWVEVALPEQTGA